IRLCAVLSRCCPDLRGKPRGDWSIKAAGQTDQSFCMRGEFVSRGHTFAWLCVFRHTQLHECDQAAEVLVASAVAHQDGDRADALMPGFLNAYLGADVRLDAVLLAAEVKTRRAINSIAI